MKPNQEAHDLMPDEIAARIPPLYSTEHQTDPIVVLKYFIPCSSWTWYVMEYNPEERLLFGLVDGHVAEFGYFSLDEIEQVRGPFGLPVERDLHWSPTPLSEIQVDLSRER